jgi:hypothetical protein
LDLHPFDSCLGPLSVRVAVARDRLVRADAGTTTSGIVDAVVEDDHLVILV